MMRTIKDLFVSILALSGLLLAMSENPYFPWPNFAGICVMAAVALLAQRAERRGDVPIRHFQASYSPVRAPLLEAWRFFRTRRDRDVRSRIDDQIALRLREIDRENIRRTRLLRYRTRGNA